MSNKFKENILKMIDQQINFKRSSYTAHVVNYNHESKTIDVKLSNTGDGMSVGGDQTQEERVENIAILNDKLLKSEEPKKGDFVYIDFINNDMSKAVLLSIIKKPDDNINNTGKSVKEPEETFSLFGGWFSKLIN